MSKLLSKYDLKLLVSQGEKEEVIQKLMDLAPTQNDETTNLIFTLSATYNKYQQNLMSGVLTAESQRVLGNEINMRLLAIIDKVNFGEFLEGGESKSDAKKREHLEEKLQEQAQDMQKTLEKERLEKEALLKKLDDFEQKHITALEKHSLLHEEKDKFQQDAFEKLQSEKEALNKRLQELETRNEGRAQFEKLDELGKVVAEKLPEEKREKTNSKKYIYAGLGGSVLVVFLLFSGIFENEFVGERWVGKWQFSDTKNSGTLELFEKNGALEGGLEMQLQNSKTLRILHDIEISADGKSISGHWHREKTEAMSGEFQLTLSSDNQSFEGNATRVFDKNKAPYKLIWKGRK